MGARTDRDAVLQQELADLVDRRRPPRDEPRANAMQSLKVELRLGLLGHDAHVRSQSCFGDCFGIVEVVLLPLRERLYVDRGNDPGRMSQSAESAADKMCAQAGLHTDDTRGKLRELLFQRETLDLFVQSHLPIAVKTNDVEDLLADIDAD